VAAGLRALADGQHFDYTGYLDKALKGDEAALGELLKFDAGLDSTAATGHGLVMKSLLGKLGDELFAKKIAAQPVEVKRRLWAGLETAGATSLKNVSPQTMKALMPSVAPAEHRGLYVFGGNNSGFRDCAEPNASYLVVDETGGNLEKNYRRLLKLPYPNQAVFADVKGFEAAYYGGFFVVTEIIKMEAKNFRNTCIPYEFWALGNEPYWQVQVSSAEGIIEYRGMDDDRTKYFAYQPPVKEKGLKIYTGINQDSGDNIRIAVDSVACSDDQRQRTDGLRYSVRTGTGHEQVGRWELKTNLGFPVNTSPTFLHLRCFLNRIFC
jgi:hypothetical protein